MIDGIIKYGHVEIHEDKINLFGFHFNGGKVSVNEILLWAKKIIDEQLDQKEYMQ